MFRPIFIITPKIANILIKLESIKQEINNLPITPQVLASMRETAKLNSIHYSTQIEGNRLTLNEVEDTISEKVGKTRDEREVLGLYAAFEECQKLASTQIQITENIIKKLHALVMGEGKTKIKPTPYRDAQNVIRESGSKRIVYLPPEAKDVAVLMRDLVVWINNTKNELPCPLRAGIAHYQFATIHPYYDGNGRLARLLTTLILHLCGYDLKGFYSLEEYYAKDLFNYYEALTIGPSHNYYLGRAESDITSWVEYFCQGMLDSFEKVRIKALKAHEKGQKDKSNNLLELDSRQRAVLSLFEKFKIITSKDIEIFFKLKPRTARDLTKQWLENGFLEIIDPSKKARKYKLSAKYHKLLFD